MYILFDIGGTKTRIAYATDLERFEEPIIISTPALYEEGLSTIIKTIEDCADGREIKIICGGIAGPFNERKQSLVGSPNLKDWIGKPLKNNLEEKFGVPVHIENDSAMVGLGEANFGAGKGFGIVAYMTVSTGVGGARFINGKIDEKSVGFEPGHQIIDADKTLVEGVGGLHVGYILSGKGVEKRTGQKPKDIADTLFWDKMAEYLAYALNNLSVFWSPDCIVLGGSMITGDPAISVEKTEERLKEILKIFPEIPVIKKASLKDVGGLYGALAYIKNYKL